ncbi:hypothetical protein BDN70DRAFT_170622 [Pholiota conissans]|uniref:C2H2-type domain-containing protein n=1 Tax=Pholiota conissans TaxID=109636 RepID=A0A9P5YXG2_9AGAR|nr:hypothetical protein BDN70DRAFT_170622 [Pholiota conissans]
MISFLHTCHTPMDPSDIALSRQLKSLHVNESQAGNSSSSHERRRFPHLPNILSDQARVLEGNHTSSSSHRAIEDDRVSLPSLSELGILDLHKKIPRDNIDQKYRSLNNPCPSITVYPKVSTLQGQHTNPVGRAGSGSPSQPFQPLRTSSPASVYSTTSDMLVDVRAQSMQAAMDDPQSASGPRKSRSLNSSPSRRTEDTDRSWLAYIVKTTRKDKNGGALYQCQYEECGHEQTKQAVKRHVNDVHFNKRPWKCEYCDQPFKQKTSLMIHVYSKHTGETPYCCAHCDECFSDPARRNKHTKRVHPEVPSKPRPKIAYPKQGTS